MALKFGGFFAQYGNLDKAIDKFNADAKVFKEFEAALKKLIGLINEGKVTMKGMGQTERRHRSASQIRAQESRSELPYRELGCAIRLPGNQVRSLGRQEPEQDS